MYEPKKSGWRLIEALRIRNLHFAKKFNSNYFHKFSWFMDTCQSYWENNCSVKCCKFVILVVGNKHFKICELKSVGIISLHKDWRDRTLILSFKSKSLDLILNGSQSWTYMNAMLKWFNIGNLIYGYIIARDWSDIMSLYKTLCVESYMLLI